MKNGQTNWAEAVKDAVSGYGAAILGIVCFLLVLALVTGVVRFVVGLGSGA